MPACNEVERAPMGSSAAPSELRSALLSGDDPNEQNYYTQIHAFGLAVSPIGLCDLVRNRQGGAGVYEVTKLVNFPIEHPFTTYAHLSLVTPWSSQAPVSPVLELPGGHGPGGSKTSHQLSLTVGEVAGFLLKKRENSEYYITGEFSIFRDLGQGYSNGFVFTKTSKTLAEVGSVVSDFYQGIAIQGDCPYQVDADVRANVGAPLSSSAPDAPRISDVIYEGEFESDKHP